jgi:cytochrome c oxidase subunit 3
LQASQTAAHELRHHFADMDQQRETASFGMWIFLVTELMFFGGSSTPRLSWKEAGT